jgi:Tol biopolymer transport system component
MGISMKHIRAVLLAAILTGAAGTACNITSLPTGAPSMSDATPQGADSTAAQPQPTTALPSPTPDLAATQAALATPTEEPFHMPGGRLLIGALTVPQAERDSVRDGWWSKYYWLSLPDGLVEPHPVLSGEFPTRDRPVSLSPDHAHLVFARETYATNTESLSPQSTFIYLLGPDDTEPVQIGPPVAKGIIKGFSWSLDGRFVAFWNSDEWNEFGGGNKNSMHIYDVQTSALKKLPVKAAQPGDPVLSPNGDRVAFANETYNPDTGGLYLINADGTGEQRLVAGAIFSPKWHPDGTRLIFEQVDVNEDPMTGPRHIYSVDLGSGAITLLTPADESSYWFVLSPDGKSLTYISEEGVIKLFVVSTDGGTPVLLAQGSGIGTDNIWSPDSQYLGYFESGGFYIMDSQGGGQVQVFQDLQIDDVVAWLP